MVISTLRAVKGVSIMGNENSSSLPAVRYAPFHKGHAGDP